MMMIFSSAFTAAFFLLIMITGGLTIITDLRHKKIRNNHLIIIAVAAVILTITKGLSDQSLSMLQLSSTGCAIIIAGVFYKNNFWRGGDAKLFILLSFLMPVTGYESRIFLPSIALFANTFIIGLIFLGLLGVKVLFTNPKLVTENILNKGTPLMLMDAMLRIFCVSWIIFPLFLAFGLTKYGFLSFLSIYLINFSLRKQISGLIYNKAFVVAVFAGGLFLRFKFSPGFFLWKNSLLYLSTVIIYSFFSIILYKETMYIAKSKDRVPFAPLLFLGCLSSYTPLLLWIMAFKHLGK